MNGLEWRMAKQLSMFHNFKWPVSTFIRRRQLHLVHYLGSNFRDIDLYIYYALTQVQQSQLP